MSLFTRPLRTPLLPHPAAPLRGNGLNLFLKAENLQRGGSYKIRGVHKFLASGRGLPPAISTVSAGNLGRAVAEAAKAHGVACTVYVPDSAPETKKEKIRAAGATIEERPFAEIFAMVEHPPADPGFLHPLLTPELPAGYGEIAHEILDDLPDCSALVVPFGLGGLALGLARALKARGSNVKLVAAELELCAPYAAALAAGRPVPVKKAASFVDAIGTPFVLPYVFEEARACIRESLAVSLAETRVALRELLLLHGMRVEGAAAVALAAAKRLALVNPRAKVAAVLSGGNIGAEVFLRECNAYRPESLASSISRTSARLSSSV